MIKIYDGRNDFYQWDLNRKVIVTDETVTEVHFCNKTSDCSLIVEVEGIEIFADGKSAVIRTANVPNILLQTDWPIYVYAYCGDCYTKESAVFKVNKRTKPDDYVYTETEVLQYSAIAARMDELENNIGGEIEKYMEEHPVEIPSLDGYMKKPEKDASGYMRVPMVNHLGADSFLRIYTQPLSSAIPQYGNGGKLQSNAPTGEKDVANKKYVDDAIANSLAGIATAEGGSY